MSQTKEMLEFPYIFQKKGDTVDIQQKNIYDYINIQKEYAQDNQIYALEKRYSEINQALGIFNQRLTNLERNNFWDNEEIEVSEEDMLQEQEQSVLTNDILEEVNQLYHAEDIQDQISCCVFIAEKTFELLKMIDKPDENNYKKQVVHLFYQVVKRNYARGKFTKDQISLMTQMIEKSRKPFVCEEEYFELDEKLYLNKLEIFPEGE